MGPALSLPLAQHALDRLARASLDSASYRREAMAALRRAVPFQGWCWALIDPQTLVPWDAVHENSVLVAQQRRLYQLDLVEDVVPSLPQLVRDNRRVDVLTHATGGEPGRSRRWDELYRPWDVGDELRATILLDDVCWSLVTLTRERSAGPFLPEEAATVRDLLGMLGEGLRRAFLRSPRAGHLAQYDMASEGPGTVVFGSDLQVVAATPMGIEWFTRLRGNDDKSRRLGALVCALVARLEMLERGAASTTLMPRSRACTPDGWLVIHAARFSGARAGTGDIAVVIEPAQPAELLPMTLRLHGLSAREREVAALVLDGRSTQEIARTMFISPYTVQDHLKAVFDKVGVRSRRELASAFSAYATNLG